MRNRRRLADLLDELVGHLRSYGRRSRPAKKAEASPTVMRTTSPMFRPLTRTPRARALRRVLAQAGQATYFR